MTGGDKDERWLLWSLGTSCCATNNSSWPVLKILPLSSNHAHTKRKFQLEEEGSCIFRAMEMDVRETKKLSSVFSEALKSLLKGLLSIVPPFSNQWKFPSRPFCDDDVTRKSTCDHFFRLNLLFAFAKRPLWRRNFVNSISFLEIKMMT